MVVDKNTFYQISGILNAFCILISGIYGFIDISIDRNNYLTNIIVNLSCIIFSFLFMYHELNSMPDQDSYCSKFILFLFSGLLILGTSDVGFALGFLVIFYSLINISLYYIEYKKKVNNPVQHNIEAGNRNSSYRNSIEREDSPPNPYKMNLPTSCNTLNNNPNNYDVNTINQNGNIIQYGSSV
jgi:hypothetical protein